jgi:hypothetical protein
MSEDVLGITKACEELDVLDEFNYLSAINNTRYYCTISDMENTLVYDILRQTCHDNLMNKYSSIPEEKFDILHSLENHLANYDEWKHYNDMELFNFAVELKSVIEKI